MTGATGYTIEAGRLPAGRCRALWEARGVLLALAEREVKVRYRQATLGVLWALAQPAALAAVSTAVLHRWLGVGVAVGDYPRFAFAGLVAFTFFQAGLTAAVPSLVQNAGLLRRIWFPREALPLASLGGAGVDLALGCGLATGWAVLAGDGPGAALLWALPALLVLLVFTSACALLGAAWNVRHRDVKHALPLVLQLLFFATPVVWPAQSAPPAWRPWLDLNPLSGVCAGLRAAWLPGASPAPDALLPGAAVALGALLLSSFAFGRLERRFADDL